VLEWLNRLFGVFPHPLKLFIKAILAPQYYFRIIRNDLKALMGNAPGEVMIASENIPKKTFFASAMPGLKSTKRKGVIGEWRHELNIEQQEMIKDKVGKLLVELGYEHDLQW
jgi:hypothetical protein